jgi:RNA polymerase sigma factor (sigma-70 family)
MYPSTQMSLLASLQQTGGCSGNHAWAAWFERYAPVIRQICQLYERNEAEVDDICQDVMVRLITTGINTFDPDRGKFRGYLFCLVKNLITDRSRARKRLNQPPLVSPDVLRQIAWFGGEDEDLVVDRTLINPSMLLAIVLVRRRVKEPTWRAFWLTEIEAQDAEQTASELGVTAASVRQARYRIRQWIGETAAALSERENGDFPKGAAEPAIPRLPGFKIESILGWGGAGVVYAGRDRHGRDVAVKVLRAVHDREGVRQRFPAEVQQLDHPNIVPIWEVKENVGRLYFSMPRIRGGTLAERLPEYRDPRTAARLIGTVARAVAHVHTHKIVHCDIKPANILLTPEGTPQLTDFGLAIARRRGQDDRPTLRGTPAYMAPEQALGMTGAVSAATDVHALGVILYELLTGRRPYQSANLAETLLNVGFSPPRRPSELRADLPPRLETICLRCLEKKLSDRPSARQLADDLDQFLDDPSS